jgi:hypothetical protein
MLAFLRFTALVLMGIGLVACTATDINGKEEGTLVVFESDAGEDSEADAGEDSEADTVEAVLCQPAVNPVCETWQCDQA